MLNNLFKEWNGATQPYYGVYQIGKMEARSWIVAGLSLGWDLPDTTAP